MYDVKFQISGWINVDAESLKHAYSEADYYLNEHLKKKCINNLKIELLHGEKIEREE